MTEGFSSKVYGFCRGMWRVISAITTPLKVYGTENIPGDGAMILCANHVSARDPLMIAIAMKRPVAFMSKKELFESKPLRWLMVRLGTFPVARGEADLSAMRTSFSILKSGDCLGIFPQGHRRKKDKTEPPMNTGVAMIAVRSKAPLIPVHIEGDYRLFRPVRMVFGAPMDFSGISHADKTAMDAVTEQIRESIFSLEVPEN